MSPPKSPILQEGIHWLPRGSGVNSVSSSLMEEGEHLWGQERVRKQWLADALTRLSPTGEGGPIVLVEELSVFDEAQAFGLQRVDEEEVEHILDTFPELAYVEQARSACENGDGT